MRTVVVIPPFAHYISDWHFSPTIDTGEFVFCSGVTGTRADDSIAGDPKSQFREAFQNLQATVRRAGLEFSDGVELTTYHVKMKQH